MTPVKASSFGRRSVDHARGLVFHRPQAASHRRAVVYFCSAVLTSTRDSRWTLRPASVSIYRKFNL